MIKARLARVALLSCSIVFSLLLVELGLTAWYGEIGEQGPYQIVEEWGSPFVFRARPDHAPHPLGLRRSRPLAERGANADPGSRGQRILSYGDSIGSGYGVEEEETYAWLLEEGLSRSRGSAGRVEVLNMNRGHSPTVYTFHLRSDVPRLRPDAVIVEVELVNDISDEALVAVSEDDAEGLPRAIHRHRYLLGWDGFLLSPLSIRGSPLERTKLYAKLSRWYGRVRQRLAPNPVFAEDSRRTFYASSSERYRLTRENLDRGFDRLFQSVAGIHRYLDRRDIRFLLVLLPSRYVYQASPYRESSRELIERAARRAEDLGIPHTVLTDAFERGGGASLFMDFCHPTPAGHRVLAAQLLPLVEGW